MRKDQLIRALVRRAAKATNGRSKPLGAGAPKKSAALGSKQTDVPAKRRSRLDARLRQIRAKLAQRKDLAFRCSEGPLGPARDRLVVMVRNPYWLQAYWELTRAGVERARAALGQYWHAARPVLRLHEVSPDGSANNVSRVLRQIDVHGGVNTWYIDVADPPKTFQLDIGYLDPGERFFCLARSNVVTTPQAALAEEFDRDWADVARDCDRILAFSGSPAADGAPEELREVLEERLRRPLGPPMAARFGPGTTLEKDGSDFNVDVDAELVVFGATEPGAQVTLRGEPVRVQSDGSFVVRCNLPDRRQVLPIVASSGDGSQQRTVILAVERNTKVMEPVQRDTPD
jgi:hypothetical protein